MQKEGRSASDDYLAVGEADALDNLALWSTKLTGTMQDEVG